MNPASWKAGTCGSRSVTTQVALPVMHTDAVRHPRRTAAFLATLGVLGMLTGCSNSTAEVDSELWVQTVAAKDRIHAVLSEMESSISPAGALIDRFPLEVKRWNTDEDAPRFPENEGTAVIYNLHQRDDAAHFDVFVASGSDDEPRGWLDPPPGRVYSCYRLNVAIAEGLVSSWYRVDDGDDRLTCPDELVRALGDGAQYRGPWLFDG